MDKRIEESYKEKLRIKNPTVELVGPYKGVKKKAQFHCLIHDVVWVTTACVPLMGCGCPKCRQERASRRLKTPHEDFVRKVQNISPELEILSFYQGGDYPITITCSCGNIHTFPQARALLEGQKCAACRYNRISQKQTKTNEDFLKELYVINPCIVPLEEYRGSHTKIKYRCSNCGFEHSATPTNLLTGYGCPNCCSSKGEAAIRRYLTQHQIVYEEQKAFPECRDILPLRFDFYIETHNLLIEYQGEQHYERRFDWTCDTPNAPASFETLQKHDEMKRVFCQKYGYKELEIKYTELKQIDKILDAIFNKKEVMPHES